NLPNPSQNLQTVLNAAPTLTIQVASNTDALNVLSAVNGLTAQSKPVTLTLNLNDSSFTDQTASPPAGVTLVINGNGTTTTIVGTSPALTVTSGIVIFTGVTFTTATDSPTILVTGGSLKLRNDTIQESTGFIDAAIMVTGGTVDLGTAGDPGNNVLNVNGLGQFVANTTAKPVPTVGDMFKVNNVTQPGRSLSATSTAPGTSIYGQSVTFTATVQPGVGLTGTPTGTVTFYDGTTLLGTGAVNTATGTATYTTSALIAGSHRITASYGGDNTFVVSTAPTTQTVTPAPTAVAVGLQTVFVGMDSVVTLTVSNTATSPIPVGTVTLKVDSTNYTGTLNANGVASFDVGVLSLGNHSLLASFTSAAPGNFAPSSKTGTLTVLDVSIYALNATASGAVNLSGSASIQIGGGVVVNSNSATALIASRTNPVTARSI